MTILQLLNVFVIQDPFDDLEFSTFRAELTPELEKGLKEALRGSRINSHVLLRLLHEVLVRAAPSRAAQDAPGPTSTSEDGDTLQQASYSYCHILTIFLCIRYPAYFDLILHP